ncbi:MAG: HD domain-containing phosphohydrolase [Fimbriimonadaceae bacterium]
MSNSANDPGLARSKILIVVDVRANAHIIERTLEWAGFGSVKTASDPLQAVALLKEHPADLIVVDYKVQALRAVDIIRAIRQATEPEFLPILVFNGPPAKDSVAQLLTAGANDYLTQAADSQEILLRVRNFLHMRVLCQGLNDKNRSLEDMVHARTLELEKSNYEVVERLSKAAEYRDDDSCLHTVRVGQLSASLARGLKMSEYEVGLILRAAPLHDIGKVGIPDRVLSKRGALTDEEFTIVKRHVAIGLAILEGGQTPLLVMAERIVASHHEHFDGSGYPNGLAGTDIPLPGRIVAVADAFDALTHNRPYRVAVSEQEAVQELRKCAGTQFDPKVVAVLETLVAAAAECGNPEAPVAAA